MLLPVLIHHHVQIDLRLHFTLEFLHMLMKECVCIKDPPTPVVQSLTDTVNESHTQEQSGEERDSLVYTHMHIIIAKRCSRPKGVF